MLTAVLFYKLGLILLTKETEAAFSARELCSSHSNIILQLFIMWRILQIQVDKKGPTLLTVFIRSYAFECEFAQKDGARYVSPHINLLLTTFFSHPAFLVCQLATVSVQVLGNITHWKVIINKTLNDYFTCHININMKW